MMAAEDASELTLEITQEDMDEARRLGLSGAEMAARAIRRQHPDVQHVTFSDDLAEIEVEVGEPLD